jgi:hypothetical protein
MLNEYLNFEDVIEETIKHGGGTGFEPAQFVFLN